MLCQALQVHSLWYKSLLEVVLVQQFLLKGSSNLDITC